MFFPIFFDEEPKRWVLLVLRSMHGVLYHKVDTTLFRAAAYLLPR